MTLPITTENITHLRAEPLDAPYGWEITFRSDNDGLYHQLYIDGRLADWTETLEQRCFVIDANSTPQKLTITAASKKDRATDWAEYLSPDVQQPSWVYPAEVIRSIHHQQDSRVELLDDHAIGQLDPTPIAARELWSEWVPRWAWGEDLFGIGGFGFDGSLAPGMGNAAFGAGCFGMDTSLVSLSTPLVEEGTHQVILRTVSPTGEVAEDVDNFVSTPPPAPTATLSVDSYDFQTDTLTLNIK